MADGASIPTGNIADFRNSKIIKTKTPLTKDQVDTQCRAGSMLRRSDSSSLSSGVYLGETQKQGIFSSIFGTKQETIYNYGCVKENDI